MIAVLIMGLAGAASAFAAVDRTPVVTKVSPNYGWNAGGNTVTITGKNFKRNGKNLVKKVTFDRTSATRVRVKSATKLTVTVPAGKGRVNVRVTTKWGTSARVAADKYTYKVPAATQMALNAGDGQTASLGAAVSIAPSVIVKDVKNDPVAGVTVTFAVASGGGSVTGASAVSDASGIAKVGSWKLGTVAGANTLTATCAGLTGSPVTFTATGDPRDPDRAAEPALRCVPTASPSSRRSRRSPASPGSTRPRSCGPDAVTGAKVTDIVADALGAAAGGDAVGRDHQLRRASGLPVPQDVHPRPAGQPRRIRHLHVCRRRDEGPDDHRPGRWPRCSSTAIPHARVMPPANGPLRFVIADSLSENMVYGPSSSSISTVNVLNVITTP